MRKVTLNVNALRVESYETVDDEPKARGTVHAYRTEITCPQTQCGQECESGPMPCWETLRWTDGDAVCFCNLDIM